MDKERADALTPDDRALGALLDAYRVEPPSEALRMRVLAAAPKARPRRAWPRPAVWLSGAGLAAACLVGLVTGAGLGSSISARDADVAGAIAPVAVFGQPLDGAQG